MPTHWSSRRALTLALTSALAVLALGAACDGGPPTPNHPTASPSGGSTVAGVTAADLTHADKLYHDGDFEEAIAIYSAAAAQGDPQQRQRALWTLARIQRSRGDNQGAEQSLQSLLALQPAPDEAARAYLLLATAQTAQGKSAGARASLLSYLDAGGPAAPYAQLQLAELDSARGEPSRAIREAQMALAQGPLPAATDTKARFALARYQDAAGDTASAIAAYERLASDAASASDQAEALWLLAGLSRRVGDDQRYQQALYSLATQYPWHARALEALDQPQLAPSPVLSTAQRAIVLFRQRLNDQAAQAFRASLAEAPDPQGAGLAHYYLGVLAERADDPAAALAEYEAAIAALQAEPSNDTLVQASWSRALLLESQHRLDEAADAFAALADAAPLAEQAPEALFRGGLVRFRQGRTADADLLWERSSQVSLDAAAQARARFWLARTAEAAGDAASAAQHLTAAASLAPLDYYGLRARALLDGASAPVEPQTPVRPPGPDWSRVEQWLRSWAGLEDPQARQLLLDGLAWRRAVELTAAGLEDEGAQEFAAVLDQATGNPWLLYRLARDLAEQGEVPAAARAAARLAQAHNDPPRQLRALAYPAEYLDLATEAASDNGFSPLLLLALVRQESFFDPSALSGAGAAGLTQVIPSTAEEIAGQLGNKSFRNSDLFRARVSLHFGAHYLSSQLDLVDGDMAAALAAYNGGPGNALRWLRAAPDDPDLFLETIDFPETHDYVRLVLENYALYRYTYGQTDQPSLPLP